MHQQECSAFERTIDFGKVTCTENFFLRREVNVARDVQSLWSRLPDSSGVTSVPLRAVRHSPLRQGPWVPRFERMRDELK